MLALFAVSRVWAWERGVRFDASSLNWFWQYVDPVLLKSHLLQSLWYLHSQPPGYNLLLGIGLKGFGSSFGTAAHGFQIAIGIAIMVSLYVLLIVLGLGRWWAAAVATIYAVSPAMILFENWLFYEYLVAALLLGAAVAFVGFERRPSAVTSFTLFSVLAALCFVRSTFQIVLLLLSLLLLLFVFSEHRGVLLAGAVIPIMLVAGLSVKNWVLFGTPSTSSWAGMNLMQVNQHAFKPRQAQELERRGVISAISDVRVFLPLAAYKGLVARSQSFAGIPVLHEKTKPSGAPNFNNIEYVAISNRYMHDFIEILLNDPGIYLRGVWVGLKTAVLPSDNDAFVLPNRAKIGPWVHGYDLAVLGQTNIHWRYGQPLGTAWGVVAGYAIALLFGAAEMFHVLRRRGGSPTVAFIWLLLVYSTIVMTFGEVVENQRVRFPTDGLVTVLATVAAARLIGYLHRHHSRTARNLEFQR